MNTFGKHGLTVDELAITMGVNYVASFLTPHVGVNFDTFCIRTCDPSIRERYSLTRVFTWQPVRWTKYSSLLQYSQIHESSILTICKPLTNLLRARRKQTSNKEKPGLLYCKCSFPHICYLDPSIKMNREIMDLTLGTYFFPLLYQWARVVE